MHIYVYIYIYIFAHISAFVADLRHILDRAWSKASALTTGNGEGSKILCAFSNLLVAFTTIAEKQRILRVHVPVLGRGLRGEASRRHGWRWSNSSNNMIMLWRQLLASSLCVTASCTCWMTSRSTG